LNGTGAAELWIDTVQLLNRDNNQNHSSMNAIFSALVPLDLSDQELLLHTSNLFSKDWVERHLTAAIEDAIWSVSGHRYGFRIVFDKTATKTFETDRHHQPEPPEPLLITPVPAPVTVALPSTSQPASLPLPPTAPSWSPLTELSSSTSLEHSVSAPLSMDSQGSPVIDPDIIPGGSYQGQTFESFVVGDANIRAFSMALQVAKTPGYIMNPLFIYGKSGLGKTHLLLSINDYISQHNSGYRTVYIQTNELVAEYSQAARNGDFSEFNRKYYYQCDVFLLDDVQFLERREETINTVFNIFNHLTANNKQVVLSADRSPNEISLHDRYLSRFNNGIIADVQAPSHEMKLTIFKNYLDFCCRRFEREDARSLIKDDVAEHIVSLSGSNIRELEGAATNLVWTLINDTKNRYLPITNEEAESIVASHFRRLEKKSIDISLIQKETENFFNVRHEDLIGSQRSQNISYPRQVAMYLCRSLTDASYPFIGNAFGGKDHTSVIHAYNNIEKKRQLSQKIDNDIKHLINQLLE